MKLQNNITKTIAFMAILASSCGDLFEPNDPIDCYELGRELTEEEKNIFPYQVGDSIVFTDGIKDYYIKCVDIVDTIYTALYTDDEDCIGEERINDEYIRLIQFMTDINIGEKSEKIYIGITKGYIAFIFMNGPEYDYHYSVTIQTEKFLKNIKTNNNTNDSPIVYYRDVIAIGNAIYYDVYEVLIDEKTDKHNVEKIYINKDKGIAGFVLLNNIKINLK